MTQRGTRLSNAPSLPDAGWRRSLRRRLLAWYGRAARDLPWRRTRDPYAIWVSEIMLQQTQVATVVSYFPRFMERFPDVRSLAEADEASVLRQWEGLGYYRRARQLHRAARIIVRDHGAKFPRDVDTVRGLPGIGRYTAGAILSIALDVRAPILEANTTRALSRLLAYDRDPSCGEGQRWLWACAESLLPRKRVGALNQALMELGSEICTPRQPRCDICPVAQECGAHKSDRQDEIPVRKKAVRYENTHEIAVVVRRRGRVLLRQCSTGQRWAGLWDYPRFAASIGHPRKTEPHIAEQIRKQFGLTIHTWKSLTRIMHTVTRFRITLDCYEATAVSGRPRHATDRLQWVRPAELEGYPLSVTGRKISRLVTGDH